MSEICQAVAGRGNKKKQCTKPVVAGGFCCVHGNINKCLGITGRGGFPCGRSPKKGSLYCAGHNKILDLSTISTNSNICQGTFKHNVLCTRPSEIMGMCGYHCKDISASLLNLSNSLDICSYSSIENPCDNHKLIDRYAPITSLNHIIMN
jgi:hypothetical protein